MIKEEDLNFSLALNEKKQKIPKGLAHPTFLHNGSSIFNESCSMISRSGSDHPSNPDRRALGLGSTVLGSGFKLLKGIYISIGGKSLAVKFNVSCLLWFSNRFIPEIWVTTNSILSPLNLSPTG